MTNAPNFIAPLTCLILIVDPEVHIDASPALELTLDPNDAHIRDDPTIVIDMLPVVAVFPQTRDDTLMPVNDNPEINVTTLPKPTVAAAFVATLMFVVTADLPFIDETDVHRLDIAADPPKLICVDTPLTDDVTYTPKIDTI